MQNILVTGGRCELANIDTVNMICDLLDEIQPREDHTSRRDLIGFVKDRPGHDLRYAIDCSKLEKELGWAPRESFESGMRNAECGIKGKQKRMTHVEC